MSRPERSHHSQSKGATNRRPRLGDASGILAAFGAKTRYERRAPRKNALRSSGTRFVDRAKTADREMGSTFSGATQTGSAALQEGAADVKATASEQAQQVTSAATAKDQVQES